MAGVPRSIGLSALVLPSPRINVYFSWIDSM